MESEGNPEKIEADEKHKGDRGKGERGKGKLYETPY